MIRPVIVWRMWRCARSHGCTRWGGLRLALSFERLTRMIGRA